MDRRNTIPELRILRSTDGVLRVAGELETRGAIPWGQLPTTKDRVARGRCLRSSPVNNVDRGPRLPDNDRMANGRWPIQDSSALNFDVGAAYIFVKDPSINSVGGVLGGPPSIAATGLINGEYSSHVVVVSGQLNYRWR